MAGNSRFDSSVAGPEELAFKGSFPNGQRGNLVNGSLDRSASFREGNAGQMLTSGANVSRGISKSSGDSAPAAQSLMLDPITMGDQKYTRSGELRRVLGISFGNTLEDCAFGTANLKSPLPVATEELKRFKASIHEASARARYRSKRLDESLHKLNKCWEAVNSKKQLRNELLPNERMPGSQSSKMGSQTHQRSSEPVNQRPEDRPKNVILNKRIRTSVAEIQAEGQSNSFMRQSLAIGKDRDNIMDGGEGCDIVEEKIRRLPVGGETWDRKMKRKRSMGTVFARSIDGERELKRVMHLKVANESGLQSSDTQGLRFNVRENNYTGGIYTLKKGKASRAPRTGNLMAGSLSSVSCSPETHEAWEQQPSNVNKPHSVSGTINHKRPLPEGSSSSHMAQWVGQRPQKISRTRRVNVVSPVLNSDELPTSLEVCSPSDVGSRMTSATSGSLVSRGKMKHENASSPTRLLAESEESGAGENDESKLKEKGLKSMEVDEKAANNSYNTSSSMLMVKKKKMSNKEETGDGPRRQGRSSRGSSVLKTGISPMKEKLEISTLTKPIRNMKVASGKNGSKSGRPPLKKSSDRKAISRLGHPSTSNSPDIAGESDDDREELLAAANFASNASYIGCSSSFWKKLESHFAPVNLDDIAYLKQLVNTTEVDQRCLSKMPCLGSDALDEVAHMDNHLSQSSFERERGRSILTQTGSKETLSIVDAVDQHQDGSFICRQMGSEANKISPLYQRVLAALIIDDQSDEETAGDANTSFLCGGDDSPMVACFSHYAENQSSIRTEYEFNTANISCDVNTPFTGGKNTHDEELGFLKVDQGPLHPETERLPMLSENGSGGSIGMHKFSCSSSPTCHFEQMSMEDKLLLELQSLGLYPDPVPDLADGDCEAIDQDIIQLQNGLFQQVTKKRECFMKLIQAVDESREMEQRALERVALDKLVELAYKKKLATRGSSAARHGLSKVSRPVAMAFMKRTLARCRKFEETGKSCFLEPIFKEVLFTAPARENYAGSVATVNPPLARSSWQEYVPSGLFPSREQDVLGNPDHPSDQDFARSGPILNRGKKKELLLDDVGAGALRSVSTLGNSFMNATKGKRSERERDKDTSGRTSVANGGRSVTKGERKTKPKSKPKTAQLSASGNGSLSKSMENTNSEHQIARDSNELISSGSNRKSRVGSASNGHNANDLPSETEVPVDFTNLHGLDPMELGVANELNEHQDLDSWFNIDEDGLLDDDVVGLDIPMDDLSVVLL